MTYLLYFLFYLLALFLRMQNILDLSILQFQIFIFLSLSNHFTSFHFSPIKYIIYKCIYACIFTFFARLSEGAHLNALQINYADNFRTQFLFITPVATVCIIFVYICMYVCVCMHILVHLTQVFNCIMLMDVRYAI